MMNSYLQRWRTLNNPTNASIYETIRQHDDDSDTSDLEERAGLALDEQNLQVDLRDLEQADLQVDQSRVTQANAARAVQPDIRPSAGRENTRLNRPKWMQRSQRRIDTDDLDDDVPASLLIEGGDDGGEQGHVQLPLPPSLIPEISPIPGVSNPQIQDQWQRTRAQHDPRTRPRSRQSQNARNTPKLLSNLALADPREKAMWRWANVIQLDNFLFDVYEYYLNHGFWSTILRRMFNLVTVAFVVGFSLFLTQCIDYRRIKGSTEMSQILIPRCASKMGFGPSFLLWIVTFVWISKLFLHVIDIRRLLRLHDFYLYLLNISENEIQSISWQEIVSRLMALRDSHPNIRPSTSVKSRRYVGTQNKQRMDAHDIANRLMRRENYMIAMINKDILEMTLPIPFLRNRQLFTRVLEWNLDQCIMDYVFSEKGQIRPLFLKDTHRKALSEGLRRRFLFAGTANLIIAPFLIGYFLIQNFFQYFNEYQKNPAQIGSRQYSPLAEWKFREFNELRHLFQRRVNMSYPFATRYINQFPKDKTVQTARFVTFISGAIVSVLGLATILDQESFLGFEITSGRTTIFYIGLFGGIWAVARGLLPDDNLVYEPSYSLQEVIEFTHYQPQHWNGRMHTVEVKTEFAQLYPMKIAILLEEVLSMVFTPFVLWFSLPKCSDRIIDFFREFTVHVDGIGYVCSFAEFNFKKVGAGDGKIGNATTSAAAAAAEDTNGFVTGGGLRDDYFASKDHKLEQSYWGFMNDYARNPKTDVRFPYGSVRRRLNLPPPIPGILSPTLTAGGAGGGVSGGGEPSNAFTIGRSVRAGGTMFSPQRALGYQSGTSRFMGLNSGSPLQSLLLDPHHQPSTIGFGDSPQALRPRSGKGFGKSQRRVIDHPEDVVEEENPGKGPSDPVEASRVGLGSWKYEDEEDDLSEEEDVEAVAGEGVGIVGLIKQFQKAQGEGNRTGTGM